MKNIIERLENLLEDGVEYIAYASEEVMNTKASPNKWSKKEILGHLVDSAVTNLKRFTEIQFEAKPYKVIPYKQDELVKANDYQSADTVEIVDLWVTLNHRIINIMSQQTVETLAYEIDLGDDKMADLEFLIVDYIDHLEHHLKQIKG